MFCKGSGLRQGTPIIGKLNLLSRTGSKYGVIYHSVNQCLEEEIVPFVENAAVLDLKNGPLVWKIPLFAKKCRLIEKIGVLTTLMA